MSNPRVDLPVWIERLLKHGSYSCSETEYVKFRQELLREQVLEVANAHENGRIRLHEACLQHLADSDDNVVRNALSCLFVIGGSTDVQAVEALLQQPSEVVRKAARTCHFEIRRRPTET